MDLLDLYIKRSLNQAEAGGPVPSSARRVRRRRYIVPSQG